MVDVSVATLGAGQTAVHKLLTHLAVGVK